MIEKRILYVDDDIQLRNDPKIRSLEKGYMILKGRTDKLKDTTLKIDVANNLEEAETTIVDKKHTYDLLIIDYRFNNEIMSLKSGLELIKKIRKEVNKRIDIIFITMNGFKSFEIAEWIEIVNNDISKIIPKDSSIYPFKLKNDKCKTLTESNQYLLENIMELFESSINVNNVVYNALKKILEKYSNLSDHMNFKVGEEKYSGSQILHALMLDEDLGNKFLEDLVEMSILKTSYISEELIGDDGWK